MAMLLIHPSIIFTSLSWYKALANLEFPIDQSCMFVGCVSRKLKHHRATLSSLHFLLSYYFSAFLRILCSGILLGLKSSHSFIKSL